MAEGIARRLSRGRVDASSAGIFPASIIQPQTFQVMEESGMPLDPEQVPRSILRVDGGEIDLMVNMSGQPATVLLRNFRGREIKWDVPDPVGMSIQVYRAVRDRIEKNVRSLIEQLESADGRR